MTLRADDLPVHPKEVIVKRFVSVAALAVAALVAAAPAAAGRTHYTSVTMSAGWFSQDGCLQRSVRVDAWESSIRQRIESSDAAQIAVLLHEWDSCTGSTVASWQGYITPAAGELELTADARSGAVRASVPVVEDVTGESAVAVVDLRLSAAETGWDTKTASHYRAAGFSVNWSGGDAGYLADVSGSVLLGGRNVAEGTAVAWLAHAESGETVVQAQALLARVASGELAGPIDYSQDNLHAVWVEWGPDGCHVSETIVAVDELTDWEGMHTANAYLQRIDYDVCTGWSDGFWATAALDSVDFRRQTLHSATLAGRLDGQRFSGEPISVSLDLEWTGTGTRDMWQLTQRSRYPDNGSTYHLNELWRGATVSGTVNGVLPGGELASAGFHSADIIVAGG
jgi:hypothetical protein